MAGRPTFELGDDEIEFGVGIHGEPGIERAAPMLPPPSLVEEILAVLLDELEPAAGSPSARRSSTGSAELPRSSSSCSTTRSAELLEARGLRGRRSLVGNFVTSLDMAGASISLLLLDDELTRLWDAPATTAALSRT